VTGNLKKRGLAGIFGYLLINLMTELPYPGSSSVFPWGAHKYQLGPHIPLLTGFHLRWGKEGFAALGDFSPSAGSRRS
jgi:hypothetical protein